MLDITKAQATQHTVNGVDQDWVITLDGEELYTLPAYIKATDTFIIRDAIEKMMKHAAAETKMQEEQLCIVKINRIIEHGDAKLDSLKEENVRLASVLEQHILSEEVI